MRKIELLGGNEFQLLSIMCSMLNSAGHFNRSDSLPSSFLSSLMMLSSSLVYWSTGTWYTCFSSISKLVFLVFSTSFCRLLFLISLLLSTSSGNFSKYWYSSSWRIAECFFFLSSLLNISFLGWGVAVPDVGNAGGLLLDIGAVHAGEGVVDLDDLPLCFLAHGNIIFECYWRYGSSHGVRLSAVVEGPQELRGLVRLRVEPLLNIIAALVLVRVYRSDVLVKVCLLQVVPLRLHQYLVACLDQFVCLVRVQHDCVISEPIPHTQFRLDRRNLAISA